MVSPRRSSRARSTAHPVTASHSSSASSSRSRRHRTEDADLDTSYSRGLDADLDGANDEPDANMADDANDEPGDQEDEITRCICGFQEYQGGDDGESDSDGLFIQCDECLVWQHGFCVGIMDPAATPDNYYCEQCKPELHKEGHSKSGMKTAIYIPAQAEFLKRATKEPGQKRRTTMNSRDAEYDDEVLKRALELSKQDAKSGSTESTRGSRGRKRGTSEGSEEPKDVKRPRTSDSPDAQATTAVSSGDDKLAKPVPMSLKKSRKENAIKNSSVVVPVPSTSSTKRTSARNKHPEKTENKKEESENSDSYTPQKNRNNKKAPVEESPAAPVVSAEPPPDTPQTNKRTVRNTGENGHKRRRGINRYTRRSEDPNESGPPISRDQPSTGHHRDKQDPTIVLEKPTKPRQVAARMTINEMKKRVNGISEYITRTQIEMANSRQSDIYAYLAWMEEKGTPVSKSTTPRSGSDAATPTSAPNSNFADPTIPRIQVNGSGTTTSILTKASEALVENMNSPAVELMELLSTRINHWQQNYGEKVQ